MAGEIPGPPEQLRGRAVATIQAGGSLKLRDAFLGHDDLLCGLAVDVVCASLVPPDDVLAGKLGDPDLLAFGAFGQDGCAHFQNAVAVHQDMPDDGLAAPFLRRLGGETRHGFAAIADLDGAGSIAASLPSESRAGHREQEQGSGQGKEWESARRKHDASSIAPGLALVKRRASWF